MAAKYYQKKPQRKIAIYETIFLKKKRQEA